jgi:hypothetical protein
MQLTAAANFKNVGGGAVRDAQRDIGLQLLGEARAELTRGAADGGLAACERRLVDGELHAQCWLADFESWQRFGIGRIRDGVADGDVG